MPKNIQTIKYLNLNCSIIKKYANNIYLVYLIEIIDFEILNFEKPISFLIQNNSLNNITTEESLGFEISDLDSRLHYFLPKINPTIDEINAFDKEINKTIIYGKESIVINNQEIKLKSIINYKKETGLVCYISDNEIICYKHKKKRKMNIYTTIRIHNEDYNFITLNETKTIKFSKSYFKDLNQNGQTIENVYKIYPHQFKGIEHYLKELNYKNNVQN